MTVEDKAPSSGCASLSRMVDEGVGALAASHWAFDSPKVEGFEARVLTAPTSLRSNDDERSSLVRKGSFRFNLSATATSSPRMLAEGWVDVLGGMLVDGLGG